MQKKGLQNPQRKGNRQIMEFWRAKRLPLVLCLTFCVENVSGDIIKGQGLSPDGKCSVIVRSPKPGAFRELIIQLSDSSSAVSLRKIARWAEITWAPDSQYVAISDHEDGRFTSVHIFRVSVIDGSSKSIDDRRMWIQKAYSTPEGSDHDECYWSIKSWKLDDGTAVITSRFREEGDGSNWTTREYTVPIESKRKIKTK